jgi:hypothetical protein
LNPLLERHKTRLRGLVESAEADGGRSKQRPYLRLQPRIHSPGSYRPVGIRGK